MRTPRVPAPLLWLLGAVAVVGIAWVLVVPPWQVPDEDSHFAYVESLVELGERPSEAERPAVEAQKSSEQDRAERASGFLRSYQRLEAHPEWAARPEREWRAAPEVERDDGGGANAAENYLPAYYLYAAGPYLAGSGGDVFDRLYAMRLFSVPLLLAFVVSAWLLAGEVLGRNRQAQVLAAAITGLVPMATFIGSAVTPDAMLLPVWGLWFWLAARVLKRLSWRDAVLLAGLTVVGICVKPTSLALLPGLLWVGAVFLWRRTGRTPPPQRTVAAGFLVVLALAAFAAAVVASGTLRQLGAYLWQFYSPLHSAGYGALPEWSLRDVWLEGTAGAFGWLEVRFPWPVYALVGLLLVGLLAATLPRLRPTALAVAFALPVLALVVGVHLTELDMLLNQNKAFAQGRYLLPLLPMLGLAAAAVVRSPALTGALLGGLAAWQLASLGIVMARFHA